MSSRSLLLAAIAIVAVVGGAIYFSSLSLAPQPTPGPLSPDAIGGGPGNIVDQANVKEFRVKGMLVTDAATGQTKPRFDVSEIKVKQGDRVKIVFENVEGRHDWRVDEFNAFTDIIEAGQTDTTEFVADKKGTFEYYCSVTGHRAAGMVGNLIVE